jgi:hypothetical protein
VRCRTASARSERGAALLATLMLGLGLVAASVSILIAAHQLTLEASARTQVLCARYAALSALALGPGRWRAADLAQEQSPYQSSARAWLEASTAVCTVHAEGRCGAGRYLAQRRLAQPCP